VALLRALGARRAQLMGILFTEYVTLGTVGAFAGLLLSGVAASWLAREAFGIGYAVHLPSMLVVWAGVVALTALTGVLAGRSAMRRPPLAVLREATE